MQIADLNSEFRIPRPEFGNRVDEGQSELFKRLRRD